MDIDKIKSVLAVAQTHSFSEAANDISLSQSSVTKHVLSIEKELDITIFKRSNISKSVTLTNDGKIFIKYAQEILGAYLRMHKEIKNLPDDQKIPMVVNTIPMPGIFSRSSILSTYFYKNPKISLIFVQKRQKDILPALLSKEIDAAIFRPLLDKGAVLPPDLWLYDARIDIFEICANPALVATSDSHHLANRHSLTLKDLKDEKFLLQRPTSSDPNGVIRYDLFLKSCINEGFEPKILPDIDPHGLQSEVNLDLVAKGAGVMIINVKMPKNMNGIRLIPLHGLSWEAKTAVAALKGHNTKLVEKLVSCLKEMSG